MYRSFLRLFCIIVVLICPHRVYSLTPEQEREKFLFDLVIDSGTTALSNGGTKVPGLIADRVLTDGIKETLKKLPYLHDWSYLGSVVNHIKSGYYFRKNYKREFGTTYAWIPHYITTQAVPDFIRYKAVEYAFDVGAEKLGPKLGVQDITYPRLLTRYLPAYYIALRCSETIKKGMGKLYDGCIRLSLSVGRRLLYG